LVVHGCASDTRGDVSGFASRSKTMSLKKALLAATVLALPVAAQAQPITGFYVGAGAGINWLMESDVSVTGNAFNAINPGFRTGNVEFSLGWGAVVSLGYGFGNGVRAEIEGNWRENDVDSMGGFLGIASPRTITGKARSYGVMGNALYDFDLGPGSWVMPYIGVGAGYVIHEYSGVRISGANGAITTIDGDQGRFAYQAILGAAFPLTSVAPGLALTAEYRFMGTLSPELSASTNIGNTVTRGNSDVDNFNHSLFVGIRYAFGVAPAPAPAPAAAPAPARTFLVFFDFGRADLTDRARQIIAEAAQNAQRAGTTRIELAGHTDTVGSASFNQGLSERRANAVAAELERRGVPRSAMVIQGFGFSRPLVPTGPNVREPQNRRVEIVLR
jgi:outer membrane protein OmpA-like peptidoglycan-associated protein